MTVAWTDNDGSGGTVEYKPLSGTVLTLAATPSDTGSGRLNVTYEATITGLTVSTTYEYRVQSGGSWSEWKTFTTPPPVGSCEPIRLVIGGDGRGGEAFYDPGFVSRHWQVIAESVHNESAHAMIYTGDLVHDGGEDAQWEDWFNMSALLTAETPVLPVLGNHDDGPGDGDNQWYNKTFALPLSSAGEWDESMDPDENGVEDIWAVVIGNVLLIGLSTEMGESEKAIQQAFLQNTISTYDAIVDWKFVFFHRPLWSSGAHGSNEDDKIGAGTLIGLIDDYGVDFVICGHDHDYERFHPSKGGYGGRPRVINPLPGDGGSSGIADGTIHVVSGGAGSFTNFVMSCREDGCFVASGNLNYMVFDINRDRADVVVRNFGSIPLLPWVNVSLQPDPLDVFSVSKASSVCGTLPDEPPDEPPDIPDVPDIADPPPDDTVSPEDDATIEPVEDAIAPDADAVEDLPADTVPADATDDHGEEPPTEEGCGCRFIVS